MYPLPEMKLPSVICHSILIPLGGKPDLGDAGGPGGPLM